MRIGATIMWAALAMALLGGPAFAQKQDKEDPYAAANEARKKEHEEIDKQYNVVRKKTETDKAAVKIDPWQNMRTTEDKAKR